MDRDRSYLETGTPVGMVLIAIGVGLWLSQLYVPVFSNLTWAALGGSLWVIVGSLLLYSDVRLYHLDRSPVERLLLETDD